MKKICFFLTCFLYFILNTNSQIANRDLDLTGNSALLTAKGNEAFLPAIISAEEDEKRRTQKNFIGVLAGIEWNTGSALVAVDLERSVYENRRMKFGLKATHFFNYTTGLLNFFGVSYEETVTINSIEITSRSFFSDKKKFFVLLNLGACYRTSKINQEKQSSSLLAFEAGFGWDFPIFQRNCISWINALTFAGDGAMTTTKIAFGF